ncbi:MAG: AAA-like domain-containing protein [Bacteroidales bacterium]|nr:AAA-like domain-containing protein [Bacteroidales bacterium]
MRKEFNVTGSCNPEWHYMVNTQKRFESVESLIDKGKYFTINRARQYGKTTTLDAIWRRLSDRYLVIPLSLEGIDSSAYASNAAFVSMFARQMKENILTLGPDDTAVGIWQNSAATSMEDLSVVISHFCNVVEKPVVVTIDEVDKSLDNQLFLDFLGMLRNKYLERNRKGMSSTFYSVVLAGVYDVKNLKLKIRPESEKKYNSPWNIAADFNVDMTFHPEEIAQMLGDYENDMHTGMDIEAISEEIYKYTNGYPFLVSYICKIIDEQFDKEWATESVVRAVKKIVQGGSTLMDDLSKNLEHYPDFREFMFQVAVNSEDYAYTLLNPMVNMGNMFSYIQNRNGRVAVHNLVFEEALYLYYTVDYSIKNSTRLSPFITNYVVNGKLNMEHVATRFRDLMHEEYRDSTVPFLEREGRLLFLTFLKPIINGTGFYYVEPQTRDNRRMDLVVTYDKQEFIVELKIWHGDKYEEHGRDQLSEYLAVRGLEEGYLVTFDFSKNKSTAEPQWIEWNGKRIFEVIV